MKQLFFILILFFPLVSLSSLEIKVDSPIEDLEWTFETTLGFQNLSNILMTKESGHQTTARALNFAGILFHSKTHGVSFSRCALNIGLTKMPIFFWSESVYRFEDANFNDDIHCLEVDAQFQLPIEFTWWYYIHPFIGYSFIDYTYNAISQGGSRNRFNTFVAGLQTNVRFSRRFSSNYFISYSPLLYANYEDDFYRYLYYGGELLIDSHPVAFTFFLSVRRAFKKNRDYFNILNYGNGTMFDLTEMGMSFHINLR